MDITHLPEEEIWINTDHLKNDGKPSYLLDKIASVAKIIEKGETTNVYVQGHQTNPKESLGLIVHMISEGIFKAQIDQKKIDETLYLIICTTPKN